MTQGTVNFRVWDRTAEAYINVDISREQIIQAFERYDREYPNNDYKPQGKAPWTEVKTYKWAVWHDGNFYPPKHILRYVIGDDKNFPGGENSGQTNDVYRNLGFEVTAKPGIS